MSPEDLAKLKAELDTHPGAKKEIPGWVQFLIMVLLVLFMFAPIIYRDIFGN